MDTAHFHTAVQKNDCEAVKRGLSENPALLETKIETYEGSGEYQTPLQLAAQWNMGPLAQILIAAGAKTEGTLSLAYGNHNVRLAGLLAAAGAIKNPQTP